MSRWLTINGEIRPAIGAHLERRAPADLLLSPRARGLAGGFRKRVGGIESHSSVCGVGVGIERANQDLPFWLAVYGPPHNPTGRRGKRNAELLVVKRYRLATSSHHHRGEMSVDGARFEFDEIPVWVVREPEVLIDDAEVHF